MANIKFSQFTVGNTESDIDFVVGYKGANNIQISPTNLLAASLSGYLPLTGGTMTGDIIFNDGVKAKFGSSSDLNIYHTGTGSVIQNAVGNLTIQQDHNDGDIIFRCDDGSGGTTPYFKLWGAISSLAVYKDMLFVNDGNDGKLKFGASQDLEIYHDGTDNFYNGTTGDMYFINKANDKDIVFQSDNGSGGYETYFFLDGSLADGTNTFTKFADNSWITMGNGGDLLIGHQTTSSKIENYTGPLYIVNKADDQDIIFQSDDGSGGIDTYFSVVGAGNRVQYNKNLRLIDNVKATFGSDDDLQIQHSSGTNIIDSTIGDLIVKVSQDDGDIIFQSDNGSGGISTYFRLDGGDVRTEFEKAALFSDDVGILFGSGGDSFIKHTGSQMSMFNDVGNMIFTNRADDGDIIFNSDDGSGNTTEYFSLDGGNVRLNAKVDLRIYDAKKLQLGNSGDLQIYHNNSNDRGYIYNTTGDLYIENDATDGDIKFFSDDGSGGTAEYFRLDGGDGINYFFKDIKFLDDGRIKFGTSSDLQIYHNATNSLIENSTGDFYISNKQDDGDIIFFCDDGSGGTATYFRLDGSEVETGFLKTTHHYDKVHM